MMFLDFLPDETLQQIYPGMDFSSEARVTPEHAAELWPAPEAGAKPFSCAPQEPKHSDVVVVTSRRTQSINSVLWGKTAIIVDGISIGGLTQPQTTALRWARGGSQ